MKRILFLEWTRGIAALLVVFHHEMSKFPLWWDFSRTWIDLGRVGVVAFFLVSGYVISMSIEVQSIRTFLVRRVFRLFPLYLVVLTVFVILEFPAANWCSWNWWIIFLINASMLQQFFGLQALLPPAWTLSIEWIFYLLKIPLKSLPKMNNVEVITYICVGIFFITNIMENLFRDHLPTSLPMLISVAFLGNAWYMFDSKTLSRAKFIRLLVLTTVIVQVGYFVGLGDELWNGVNSSVSFTAGLMLFACFYFLRNSFTLKLLIWLGALSYAIYLIEPVASNLVSRLMLQYSLLSMVAVFLLTITLAWLAHRYIESPGIALGKHFLLSQHKLHKRPSMKPKE